MNDNELTSKLFREHRYVVVDDFVDARICALATQYALFDRIGAREPSDDRQVPAVLSRYADPLMEALLLDRKEALENATGLKLMPTYSYYRLYEADAVLPKHTDRPSCEVSVSICFGFLYKKAPVDYKWPLFIAHNEHDAGTSIAMKVGRGIIYRGRELFHWREKFCVDEDSYHVQAFLHYVDAEGPYARSCAFDGRPALGLPYTTRDLGRLPSEDTQHQQQNKRLL